MNRWTGQMVVCLAIVVFSAAQDSAAEAKGAATMKAGFAAIGINPSLGTTMMGFGSRDKAQGCTGIHDDIFVRALYLEHGGDAALIMAYDLCFIGRGDADQFKGAIGRRLDLSPMQILMNTSHNHVGPAVGTWYDAHPNAEYVKKLEEATVRAACEAKEAARETTLWAGATRSKLPMSRRRNEGGNVINAPNPGGYVFDYLPVCMLKGQDGSPVCVVFSVACHPSMMTGWEISAEYPGVAARRIDEHLGAQVSMFLQGTGGDATPSVLGEGLDRWSTATWDDMEVAGGILAQEVIGALEAGLDQLEPELAALSLEVDWPLVEADSRHYYEGIAADEQQNEVRRTWARQVVATLDAGEPLPEAATLTVQGVQIGKGLRVIGIEGEAVAGWGKFIKDFYGDGVTFALGYSNGEGLYLPMSEMMDEGGYEVVSYWEYGYPSRLAEGFEGILAKALRRLSAAGIR